MNDAFGAFARTVFRHLGIEASTLRTWSNKIEEHKYSFEKNNRGHRIYYQNEIEALSEMKVMLGKGHSLDDAAKATALRLIEEKNAKMAISVIDNKNASVAPPSEHLETVVKRAVEKAIDEKTEVILKEFQEFQEKLREYITQKDSALINEMQKREKMLLEEIKQLKEETRLQIAASQEPKEQEVKEEKKKGFFNRLFGK